MKKPPGTWAVADLYPQIVRGERSVIAIDETASVEVPGSHPQRVAHVSIMVSRDRIIGVRQHMLFLLEQLNEACGAGFFHFSQLYAAKGPYAGLTIEQRLAILYAFARLFRTYEIPIWVAQLDPDTLASAGENQPESGDADQDSVRGGMSNAWGDPVNATRLLALKLAVQYAEQDDAHFPCVAFMDRLHNTLQVGVPVDVVDGKSVPSFAQLDPPGLVADYAVRNIFIQLADFAAWSYSRLELLVSRMPFEKPLDEMTFALLRKILRCHQIYPSFVDKWDDLWVSEDPPFRPSRFRFHAEWGGERVDPPKLIEVPSPT